MRLLLLFALPFLVRPVDAQSWCAPGAAWTYTFSNGWTHEGYAHFSYVGDTTVGGVVAQHIRQYAEGTAAGDPFAWELEPVITTVDGQLVSIWNGTAFDTLFHFGAVPGDSWRLAPSHMDPGPMVLVVDTGTAMIDGIALRYLVTSDPDTLIERLGCLHRYMIPWTMIMLDAPVGPLRCYSDDDIAYHASWWDYDCNSMLSVQEYLSAVTIPYPNPSTNHFTLDLATGLHAVSLYDATGRCVLELRSAQGLTVMDAQPLPPGLYSVRITNGIGSVQHHKWVKE